jgi:DNA-binding GntR family transcriptional regulator
MEQALDNLYLSIFRRITCGILSAGTRLKEDELAREFGVSRTPVRAALRLLAQDGLVEILPNRGARASGFTADDLESIYEIRKVLELLALDLTGLNLKIQTLIDIKAQLDAAWASGDPIDNARVDARLHGFIIETCHRRRLIRMLNQQFRLMQAFREIGFHDESIRNDSYQEHLALIHYLSIRDMTESKRLLELHIQNSKIRVLQRVFHQVISNT